MTAAISKDIVLEQDGWILPAVSTRALWRVLTVATASQRCGASSTHRSTARHAQATWIGAALCHRPIAVQAGQTSATDQFHFVGLLVH